MMDSDLIHGLEERGYKGAVVPIQRLNDLQREIDRCYTEGLLDEEFYQESLRLFLFAPPDSLPQPSSLIVVAVPRPQFRIVFSWRNKRFPVLVPSYYLRWRETERQLEEALRQLVLPSGHRFARATLPIKILAVSSGLGTYGRNNICYVPGMGSFHRLWAFYSDMVCRSDSWQDARLLQACEECSACLRRCPTGAIAQERVLLRAERCITFHNERSGDIPFPRWMDPCWHNALIGCSHCQTVCPINRDFTARIEPGEEFSEEETALLLEGSPTEELLPATLKKLQRMDLVDWYDLLPRNLSALLNGAGLSSGSFCHTKQRTVYS